MTVHKAGGLAAMTCAATYLVGFALLVTVLAPLGFGTDEIDALAVVDFIADRPGVLIVWNTTIYVVNALALMVLVVTLHGQIARRLPDAAALSGAIGLIWATLVLGAGMIANVAVERTRALADDPEAAASFWQILHTVELGLGGGNEIAGGVWLLSVSSAGFASGSLNRFITGLGVVCGIAGISTILPQVGEVAGAVFGLGAIVWFVAVGLVLFRGGQTEPSKVSGNVSDQSLDVI